MTMKAVLGLGGNLGDREQNLAAALDGLEQLPGTQIFQRVRDRALRRDGQPG